VEASTRLRIRVSPGARSSGVVGRYGDAWKLRVEAAPEGGRANDAVLRLLADTLALRPRDVTLVSGHAAREKVVAVEGIDAEETSRRLTAAGSKRSGR
jgi:uncharacterized protein YggU (UPF0235/DUF167 family)